MDGERRWKKLLFFLPIFNNYISPIYMEGKMLPSRLQIVLGLPNIFSVYAQALWSFSRSRTSIHVHMLPRSPPQCVMLIFEKAQRTILRRTLPSSATPWPPPLLSDEGLRRPRRHSKWEAIRSTLLLFLAPLSLHPSSLDLVALPRR